MNDINTNNNKSKNNNNNSTNTTNNKKICYISTLGSFSRQKR